MLNVQVHGGNKIHPIYRDNFIPVKKRNINIFFQTLVQLQPFGSLTNIILSTFQPHDVASLAPVG